MQIKYTNSESVITEPITLEEAKAHLRVDLDEEDTIISSLITAAREMLESETNRAFVRRGFEMKFDCFPYCHVITLQGGDVDEESVSIEYVDYNEQSITLAANAYWIDSHSPIARIVSAYGWPSTFSGRPNCVTITYDAGFTVLPVALKHAMLLMIGHLYENRQAVVNGTLNEIPLGVKYLVNPYIIVQDVTNEGIYWKTR